MDNWRVWIGVGKWELLKACLSRKYFLQYTFKLCQVGLESFILLFYHQMLLLYFINNFPSFQLVVFGNYCHDSWRHICGYIVLWCCCDLWQCLMDWLKFPWSFQGFLFSTSKRDCRRFLGYSSLMLLVLSICLKVKTSMFWHILQQHCELMFSALSRFLWVLLIKIKWL